MKQVNLTITFDEEKLSALKRYMGKKELDLDREMTDALVKLYEKYVPAPVREYIDESDVNAAAPNKSRRSPKPVTPKPRHHTLDRRAVVRRSEQTTEGGNAGGASGEYP